MSHARTQLVTQALLCVALAACLNSGEGGAQYSDECAFAYNDVYTGPHEVTFRLSNASGSDVVIARGCSTEYTLTTCQPGDWKPIRTTNDTCVSTCPTVGAVPCGLCLREPAAVDSGSALELVWSGFDHHAPESETTSPFCTTAEPLPAALYRIRVPVYAAEPSWVRGTSWDRTPLYTVTAEFSTGNETNIVDIPIDEAPTTQF